MNNRIQTPYEILDTKDEQVVKDIFNELSDDEKILWHKRWGDDLNNPILDSSWNSSDSINFHTKLVPHMKKLFAEKMTIVSDNPLTIYKLLKTNRKDLVAEIINELTDEEKDLFKKKNGEDLENPVLSEDWTNRDRINFYSHLLPKMETMLEEKEAQENSILKDEENHTLSDEEALVDAENKDVILEETSNKIPEILKKKTGKKPSSVFKLLNTNDKELVMKLINELSENEQKLFWRRNGSDLDHPVTSEDWTHKDKIAFGNLMTRLQRQVKKELEIEEKMTLKDDKNSVLVDSEVLENKDVILDEVSNGNSQVLNKEGGKKLKTIYELLNTDDKAFVNELIETLTVDEKILFDRRNGSDLDNPKHSEDWTNDDNINFISIVVRKLKYRMQKRLEIKEKAYQLISIYEILKTSNEQDVTDIINSLTDTERELFTRRNGEDMHHPIISENWTLDDEYVYFHDLVPRMQRKLSGKYNGSKVGEKLASIYKLLGINNKDLIMKIVSSDLNKDEQELFIRRNGHDLDNPIVSEDWTSADTANFSNHLLPKLRRILDQKYNIQTKRLNGFKTMFELLNIDDSKESEELILDLKNNLTEEGQRIFDRRNGSDLRHPKHSEDWTSVDTIDFNDKVLKKMRRLLIKKQNGKVLRYLSIYKLLNTDDVNLVQKVIDRLKPEEQELFWKRNGKDLNNPMPSADYNSLDQNRFSVNLIPKMRKLMYEEKSKQNNDTNPEILEIDDSLSQIDNSEKTLGNKTEEVIKPEEKDLESISVKSDENNYLPYFDKFLGKLPIKEAVIISLKLILKVNLDEISKFLKIEKTEITTVIKNNLNIYKIYFTNYIDNLIDEKINPTLGEEKDYLDIIKNLSFGELLDKLSLVESIIVCLSLGLVNEKMYSVDEISNFLGIAKENVIIMNKKALLTYKQIINDNINKVIESVTDITK